MNRPACLLMLPALVLPLQAGPWAPIPKEVWAMKDNPTLVAAGAVILERKLDFQPAYFEQTLRVRILSQAGVAAAEFTELPPNIMSLDGQVTFPDGKVQPLRKREDFLVRKVATTVEGTVKEGVLIPPGVTADCVVEVRWREATEFGRAQSLGHGLIDKGFLPERLGNFCCWQLASAYPTQVCVVQRSREVYWPAVFLSPNGFGLVQGSSSMGETHTFHNLPALPQVPFSLPIHNPAPKVLLFRPLDRVSGLEAKTPSSEYWQKVMDQYYKEWFQRLVTKGDAYKAFSEEMRKDLSGGAQDRAKRIAERIAKRTVNLDHLLYDEKPSALARQFVEISGVSDLNYTSRTGYMDDHGAVRLLVHVLLDEGLAPQVALVSDRRDWVVNPEVRTPFQFSHILVRVEQPGQPALWLDPTGRLVPPGEVPPQYQGTTAVTLDCATWKAGFSDLKPAAASVNRRTFTFQVDLSEETAKVQMDMSGQGAAVLGIRTFLGSKAPAERETWFRDRLERAGLTITHLEVRNALDPSQPLSYTATGTQPVEPGRVLKFNPFRGMDAGPLLADNMPEQRLDPIIMPYLCIQEARSTVKLPKGYGLPTPIRMVHSTQWGTVLLDVRATDSGDELIAQMKLSTLTASNLAPAYGSLKDFLQWARQAVYPEITLEKSAGAGQ